MHREMSDTPLIWLYRVMFVKSILVPTHGRRGMTYSISYGVALLADEMDILDALAEHSSKRYGAITELEAESNFHHLKKGRSGIVLARYKRGKSPAIHIVMRAPHSQCWVMLEEEWLLMNESQLRTDTRIMRSHASMLGWKSSKPQRMPKWYWRFAASVSDTD